MADSGVAGLKWTVGIITAPRERGYYLDHTIESLTRAGFCEPIVFAEPGSLVPEGVCLVQRPKNYGDWTNWATGLYELLLSNPESDYFLMTEDDALLCKDAKRYLEYALPALGEFASLSLYTPSIYRNRHRCFHNELRGRRTWSTVMVVIHRSKAISFYSDREVQRHRFENIFGESPQYWRCDKVDFRNSIKDAVIGQWATKYNLPIYYHTPSLAEHIGEFSTLTDQPSQVENGRMSADFVGEYADLSEWLKEPIIVKKHASVLLH